MSPVSLAETLSIYCGEKINVATIGNMVPQLHMHHVVRFETMPPGPDLSGERWLQRPIRQQLFSETAASIVTALAPLGLQRLNLAA